MRDQSQVELLLRRDRLIVGASLAAITVVAWIYMTREARGMVDTGVCRCLGMNMSGPDARPWSPLQLVPLFLMWTEMMVAMMIPSAAPMILMFAALNRRRRESERPYVSTGIFLLGYITIWTGFSLLAAAAQWILHGAALLSPLMVSTSPVLGGILLVAAGIFQWTPLKHVCLRHCRSPLSFFTADWREGRRGAWLMGIKHGAYCAGCCWILMALLFVAGVMNLWWIALISIFVLVEKLAPRGIFLGQMCGGLLIAWGIWMICAGRGLVL
jgi:predicted metal-binding membrane protein